MDMMEASDGPLLSLDVIRKRGKAGSGDPAMYD
jgi:hypothetical protein